MNARKKVTVLFIRRRTEEFKRYFAAHLADLPEVELVFPEDDAPEALLEFAPGADVIIGWRPTRELLFAAKRLKLFINPGAGVQHLVGLFRELNEVRPVTLVNGHGNSYFTAQHVVAMLLALTNRVVAHHNWMADGRWRTGDEEAASAPLRDRFVGLLGYGHVNRLVHRFLSGFDLSFAALKRDWSKPVGAPPTAVEKYGPGELPGFLERIDTLIIALPLTSKTDGLIGDRELALLGENGLLVNAARGRIVDEKALYDALRDRTVAGAAIDVWYDYDRESEADGRKYPYGYPFHELENVVLSPHRAASPFGDLGRWDEVFENVRRFAAGETEFVNTVDLVEGY
jgi:phosphoglycerate dehydrogenase-like enzyme